MGAAGVTGKPLPTATVGGGGGGVCPRAGGPGRHRRPSGAASIRGLACAAAPSAAASGAAGVGSSAFWPRCTRPRGPPAVAPLSLAQRCPEFLEGRASNFPLPGLGTCCWWAAAAAAAERSICVSGCRVPTAPTRPLTHAAAAQPSVGGGGGWGTGAGAGGPPSRRAGARGSWPPAGWACLPGGIIGGDPSGTGKIAASSNPPHLAFQN